MQLTNMRILVFVFTGHNKNTKIKLCFDILTGLLQCNSVSNEWGCIAKIKGINMSKGVIFSLED